MEMITVTIARKRTPIEPRLDQLQLTSVMHALSDPIRLSIVRALAHTELGRACRHCACPSVPKSTLAHHLKVLREAGLIRSQCVGTAIHNQLRTADIELRFPGLLGLILFDLANESTNN
jgi:DNA-binding transcriptional ArsR family regulator